MAAKLRLLEIYNKRLEEVGYTGACCPRPASAGCTQTASLPLAALLFSGHVLRV